MDIFELTQAAKDSGMSLDVLQLSKVGSVWYAAVKVTGSPNPAPYVPDESGSYVAAAVVLTTRRGGEWGYKDMSETSGPNAAHAPLSLIDKLSPLSDHGAAVYAKSWRGRCAVHAARIKPQEGDRIRLAAPLPFTGRNGQPVAVQEVTATHYVTRGKRRRCYMHPEVGLLRIRPDDLTGATLLHPEPA